MSPAELKRLGWSEFDVLLVSGDAYIDHPSFAMALLGRWLVHCGFKTALVCQPRWTGIEDIASLGRPRLFAGISAGALDSMVAHYTAFRKKRHNDAYSPGGQAGLRPNRATVVYTNLVKQAFPGLPVVLGGLEASLRRLAHYDFWSDSLRRPLLFDAKADILVYGMGEKPLVEIARRLQSAREQSSAPPLNEVLKDIPGTAVITGNAPQGAEPLPSYEEIQQTPALLMQATLRLERQVHEGGPALLQNVGRRCLVVNPPSPLPDSAELDALYALPYRRAPHPQYKQPIPANEMIRFSINTHRGCGGGCSFCSLALHQGRRIASRSPQSIAAEAKELTKHPDFKGSISDIGGPSANMWRCACTNSRTCRRSSCLTPEICPFFSDQQMQYVGLLRSVSSLPGIKHVRIASGIRHDWALHNIPALKAYVQEFTGGQLKIAPEHSETNVLRLMRKPTLEKFEEFLRRFTGFSAQCGKEQYLIPYLLSAFPGCTDSDMRRAADWLRTHNWKPQQVQCFIPTPGTVATAMYYGGISPDGAPVKVARSDAERLRQHAILMPTSDAFAEVHQQRRQRRQDSQTFSAKTNTPKQKSKQKSRRSR